MILKLPGMVVFQAGDMMATPHCLRHHASLNAAHAVGYMVLLLDCNADSDVPDAVGAELRMENHDHDLKNDADGELISMRWETSIT